MFIHSHHFFQICSTILHFHVYLVTFPTAFQTKLGILQHLLLNSLEHIFYKQGKNYSPVNKWKNFNIEKRLLANL